MKAGFAATLLLGLAASPAALADDNACERRISVVGTARASHAPDFIALTILTESKAPTIAGALDGSAKSIAGIGAIARDLGAPAGDIRTASAVLENATRTVSRTLGSDQREADGYRVVNRVRVRLTDRGRTGDFVRRVLEVPGARIDFVELGLTDPDKAEAALRVAAGKDARAQASALAEAAGAGAGVLCSLKSGKVQGSWPLQQPDSHPKKFGRYDSSSGEGRKAELYIPLESEPLELTAEVSAEFAAQP